MHDDLQARLFEAAGEIERSATPMGTVSVERLRASARRHRVQRRTTQSVAGVAAAAVVALVVTLGAQHRSDSTPVPPAVIDTPTPTPSTSTPTPSGSAPIAPSPGLTPTATDQPVRAADISDADVLAHLQSPRTGEVWQTPTEAPDFAAQIGVDDTAYRVGTHGDAEVYMTVSSPFFEWGLLVTGLYERDSSGVRLIACPSARSGDPCVGDEDGDVVPGVLRDDSTFYDTLTLPAKVSLDDGFDLTTAATRQEMAMNGDVYGKVADPQLEDRAVETVRDLGAVAVVTVTWRSEVAGLTNLAYALTTPLGSQVRLEAGDVPAGDFASIRWDDGIVRGEAGAFEQSRSPGAPTCEPARYAVDDGHDTSQWRRAGTTADGRPVYVPVQGGNSVSRAVRERQESTSWTFSEEVGDTVYGAATGYPYPTDESFLAADALYAIAGPDGQWLLGMRDDASQIVYECA